jgi:hypothetical protein
MSDDHRPSVRCLKANFSCEWKIFKVIVERALAIIIVFVFEVYTREFVPRENVSTAISYQTSRRQRYFFSKHIQNIFSFSLRLVYYMWSCKCLCMRLNSAEKRKE